MKAFLRTHRLLPLATVVLLVGLLGLVSQRLGLVHAATALPVTSCPDEPSLFADIFTARSGGTARFNISSPRTVPIT